MVQEKKRSRRGSYFALDMLHIVIGVPTAMTVFTETAEEINRGRREQR